MEGRKDGRSVSTQPSSLPVFQFFILFWGLHHFLDNRIALFFADAERLMYYGPIF